MTASGKTTLARRLSKKLGYPLFSTDEMVYERKWTQKYPRSERLVKLDRMLKQKSWILEGVHAMAWTVPAIKEADDIVLIDIPKSNLLKRILKRSKKKEKSRKADPFYSKFKLLYWGFRWGPESFFAYEKYAKRKFIILESVKGIDSFVKNVQGAKR